MHGAWSAGARATPTGTACTRSANAVSYTHLDVYKRQVLDLALNKSASEKDLLYARRVVLSDEDIYIAGAAREGIAVCGLRKDCSLYHGERDLAFFKSAKDLAA